jgi:hypothetical protein
VKILLDEMLPPQTRDILKEHQVSSVQDMGWSGLKNGELLKNAGANFDVFLTADKNIRYQQNLKRFDVSVVVLPSNRVEILLALSGSLRAALQGITRGTLVQL